MKQQALSMGRGRRLGTIPPANEKLAFERVVKLPLDLAILYAAVQNFRLDLVKGFYTGIGQWHYHCVSYIQEASELLGETGANHFPGDNGLPWIQVMQEHGTRPPLSKQVTALKRVFDEIFRDGQEWALDGSAYPTPSNCVTSAQIQQFIDFWQ